MPDIEHILLRTGLTLQQAAHRLAEVLDADAISHDGGRVSVRRTVTSDPHQSVGGYVVENEEENPAPGEESIYDTYDTLFELWLSRPGDEDLLHSEASRVFDEIVTALHWPAAHTNVSGQLFSAWAPDRGRTDFPSGTSYDAGSRHLWQPYAQH